MSVHFEKKVLFTSTPCFMAAMLMAVGLILCTWHMSWAEVYAIHDKGKKLIYSNAPVTSSVSPDIRPLRERSNASKTSKAEEASGLRRSNTEVKAIQEGSETNQGIVRIRQNAKTEKKNMEIQGPANSSSLLEEGGI